MSDSRTPFLIDFERSLPMDDKTGPLNSEKPYALVDVDETLIRATDPETGFNLAIDYDHIDIDKGLPDKYINLNLIAALINFRVTNLYLFTDMRHYSDSVKERKALIKSLQNKGLTVHGVITPSDYAFPILTENHVKSFNEAKSKNDVNNVIKSILVENAGSISQAHSLSSIGIAFNSFPTCDEKDAVQMHTKKCDLAKIVIDQLAFEQKDKIKLLPDQKNFHNKGLLYKLFYQYKPKDLSHCFVIDDRKDVLDSVKVVHQSITTQEINPQPLTCIRVNLKNNSVDTIETYQDGINPDYRRAVILAETRANEYRKSLQSCCTWFVPHIKRKQLKLEAIKLFIQHLKENPWKQISECITFVKKHYAGIKNHALSQGNDAWEEILKGKQMKRLFDEVLKKPKEHVMLINAKNSNCLNGKNR